MEDEKKISESESRIRAITRFYYSNVKIQEALVKFGIGREVVPRYFDGFGKRPDMIQYPSDIMGLVQKGATSFHASEEIWKDPLGLGSEINAEEMDELRKDWDLLIDIDSKYLDYSKIAAKLMIEALEDFGIKNFGLKFSGNKGFHILVSGKAFPEEFEGKKRKEAFPEWPRIMSEFLVTLIRPKYNKLITEQEINFKALKERTKLSKEDLTEVLCTQCNRPSKKGNLVTFQCSDCKTTIKRKNIQVTKRRLKCTNNWCAGIFEKTKEEPYYFCEYCNLSNLSHDSGTSKIVYTSDAKKSSNYSEFSEGISGNKLAGLDMILVSPRHLFRMPYSLHEKTALVSAVIDKSQLESFSPRDADPMTIKIKDFYPENFAEEGARLLREAIVWKRANQSQEEMLEKNKKPAKEYSQVNFEGVSEEMFPQSIKKLLKGLNEGRKRGLFILITFLRALNFADEYVSAKVAEWNKKNEPPLKEGYIKSQLDWHFKQKKKILPPNYSNESFYKDLGLIEKTPDAKNPIVEVTRRLFREKMGS